MRRLRFLPALLAVLFCACSENIIEKRPDADSDQVGSVSIMLSSDLRNEVKGTRADALEEAYDDFRVAIYKVATGMRLYNDSYANSKDRKIHLNAGEYRLVAQHGDTLGCGFDMPYYLADPEFVVEGGKDNAVEAVARLANVRLAVVYDETISSNYSDYYVIIRHNGYKSKNIRFSKTETRCGYIPAGELTLEVYAEIDGTWKYFKREPAVYAPNDFVTFTITKNASNGDLLININVDSYAEPKNETIEISAITVPQDAPSITLAGFDDPGNVHEMVEGVEESGNAMVSFIARGALSSCVLTVDSDYLASKGIPSEVDFANLTSEQKAVLKAAGFAWDEGMKTSRKFSYVDFSDVIRNMHAAFPSDVEDVVVGEFSLKVTDSVGKEFTEEFKIVSGAVRPVLSIPEYDVWARKIVSPVVTLNGKGKPSLLKLQYTTDNVSWNDLDLTPSFEGYSADFGIVETAPSTEYHVRAIYNGNPSAVSPVVTVRTEDALQLDNSSFENWTEKPYTYDQTLLDRNNNMPWFQPWTGEQWWDTNATNSLKDDVVAAYTYFRLFPCVQYSVDAKDGGKSAQVIVVNCGGANSVSAGTGTNGTWYVGELFLGRGNDGDNGGWSRTSDGHAFASRPSALTFWYEYVPYSSSDTFGADVTVKAADGTVLATRSIKGSSASEWTKMTVELPYTVTDRKAASIHVNFKASTSSSHSCAVGGEYLEVAGKRPTGDASRIKLSATLRVDLVELVY